MAQNKKEAPASFLAYYSLASEPFSAGSGYRCCFPHRSYVKTRAYLQYAMKQWDGFVMVTGGPGVGKTTLLDDLMLRLADKPILARKVSAAHLPEDDLLRAAARSFGAAIDDADTATVLRSTERLLIERLKKGQRALLLLDDAHELSWRALGYLNLLAELRLGERQLIQLFLVGREELADVIQGQRMEQFHGRLIAASQLSALTRDETRAYLECRLRCAGWLGDPQITPEAYRLIHQLSLGIPLEINLIASQLLREGSASKKRSLDADDVRSVAATLRKITGLKRGARSHAISPNRGAGLAPGISKVVEGGRPGRGSTGVESKDGPDPMSESVTQVWRTLSPPAEALTDDGAPDPPGSSKKGHPCLVARNGKLAGVVHLLRRGKTLIGREADCDFVLDDQGASRRHAELDYEEEGSVVLHELGATNGTWVNGRRVQTHKLKNGDRIQFGSRTVFTFHTPQSPRTKRVAQ